MAMVGRIFLYQTVLHVITHLKHTAALAAPTQNDLLFTEIEKRYSQCVVHLVCLTERVDFAAPTSFPVIMDRWTMDLEHVVGLRKRKRFLRVIQKLTKNRIESRPTIGKLQRFSCFINMIVASGSENVMVTDLLLNRYTTQRAETLQMLLRQDYALGLESHWHDGDEHKYFTEPRIFFPESTILFCLDCNFSVDEFQRQSAALDAKLFQDSSHLPNIVLLMASSETAHPHDDGRNGGSIKRTKCTTAFVFCRYCDKEEPYLLLGCPQEIVSAARRKVAQCINHVPWPYVDWVVDYDRSEPCPLTLSSRRFCPEEFNLIHIALGSLNLTAYENLPTNLVARIPSIQLAAINSNMEFVAPAKNVEYILFTADGVYRNSTLDIRAVQPLLQPFRGLVWVGVIVSCLAIALTAASLHHHRERFDVKEFLTVVYFIMTTPLGQTQNNPLRKHGRIGVKQQIERILRKKVIFVWTLWLLSSTLITTNYSAVFNSNYMTEPIYARNWTAGLLGMDDFKIYLGFDEPPLNEIQNDLQDGHFLYDKLCTRALSPSRRDPCDFRNMYFRAMTSMNLEDSFYRVRLVPMALLENVIPTHLMTPKTLFVSPRPFAQIDWQYFRRAMRSDKSVKFAQNPDREHGSLEAHSLAYGFTKGLDQSHKDNVPRRLKVAVNSGLFELWRKWKNWRLQFSQRGNLGDEMLWLPLSVSGSDLYHVFTLFGIGVASALCVLILEICVMLFCNFAGYLQERIAEKLNGCFAPTVLI